MVIVLYIHVRCYVLIDPWYCCDVLIYPCCCMLCINISCYLLHVTYRLAHELRHAHSLTHLFLGSNHFGSSAILLIHAIPQHTRLSHLSLSHNHMGDDACQALIELVTTRTSMVCVEREGNGWEMGEQEDSKLQYAVSDGRVCDVMMHVI